MESSFGRRGSRSLSGDKVYQDLFNLTDEAEMGHIELSRSADLVVVAPATADLMAKMATGVADDLATTLLLATDKPVLAYCRSGTRSTLLWALAEASRGQSPHDQRRPAM